MLESLKSKLSRVQNQNFIPEIDGLRFIAIFLVILLHVKTHFIRINNGLYQDSDFLDQAIFRLIYHGDVGVRIFFSISGFILALPFVSAVKNGKDFPKIRNFYLRRLTRLEPPFFLVLIALFLMNVVLGVPDVFDYLKHLLASLAYSHFFIYNTWSTINPVTWSLETEIQFYILLPLLAILFKWKNFTGRNLLMIIVVAFIAIYAGHTNLKTYHLSKSLLKYLPYFMGGYFLADLYINRNEFFKGKKTYLFDVLGIAALMIISDFWQLVKIWPSKGIEDLSDAFLIVLVLFSAFKGKIFNWFFTNSWIVVIGGMCYSIYLLHYALIFIIGEIWKKIGVQIGLDFWPNYLSFLLINAVIILGVSMVFFYFFEKPFMHKDWPQKFGYWIRKRFS